MNNPFEIIETRLSNIENLLLDLKHHPKAWNPIPDEEVLFDIDEFRASLPENPAKQTVYGWVNDRKVPYEKYGKKLYFRKSSINKWLVNARKA
jgi:hypothetical protein